MAELSDAGAIPSPEAFARKRLRGMPAWLQRLVSNALAVCAWIGLPSTVLSTLADMSWVVRAAAWLYEHAGMARPALLAAGEGLHAAIELWRQLTHPFWQTFAGWLHWPLPSWAPDALTLLALLAMGMMRRFLRVAWGDTVSGGLMIKGARPDFGRPEEKIAIPRSFPYEQHFAECDVKWTPARLRDTRRLWRKWRRSQIRMMLADDGRHWPTFHRDVVCAQFERYWLSVTEGRRDMLVYASAAALVFLALAIDWVLRLTA